MRRVSAVTGGVLAVVLPWTLLVATPPASATSVAAVCSATYSFPFDLAAGAALTVPHGTRPATAAGMASAKALAAEASAEVGTNPCTTPLGESATAQIDSVQDYVDSGDAAGARAYLREILAGLAFVAGRSHPAPRAGSTCDAFTSHDVTAPDSVRTALGVAQEAQLLGYDDVASEAVAKAASITTDWAGTGADGQATSVADWLGIAAKLQALGADEGAIDKALTRMTTVAQDAYDQFNTSACRATPSSITCFFKAAQFLAMTGHEPAGFQADVAYQAKAAKSAGRKQKCPTEKYLLRLTSDSYDGDGQRGHFDTGQMTLTVKDRRVTSADRGPLVITGGRATCWFKNDETWVREGTGTMTGGSFPYRVSGTDDGEALHVSLAQSAKVAVQMNGNEACQAVAELTVQLTNTFLHGFAAPGLELPAGVKGIDATTTTYDVFEPTGETTSITLHEIFRMISPRR